MMVPRGAVLVSEIAGKRAVLKLNDASSAATKLILDGFKWEGETLVHPIADQAERQKLILELIAMGALFARGPDWSLSELVEYYREQELVHGTYLRIVWKTPDEYVVSET